MSEKYECANCGGSDLRCELSDIPDLNERLEPGGEVPAGECEECGCLSYLVKETNETPTKNQQEHGGDPVAKPAAVPDPTGWPEAGEVQ